MLTTSQKIKESLLLATLNILLPSADIYFDVYFIIRLNLGRPLHLSVIPSLGSYGYEAESLLEQCNDFKFNSWGYKIVFNTEEEFEECIRNRTAEGTLKQCSDISFNTEDVEECARSLSANSIYHVRHPKWAALLLGPCLINYALCWFAWYSTDKKKAFTWIAPLLSCYPQLVAASAIWLLWTQPSEGMRVKKHLERNLMGNEVFTEAVPTALAMTFFMIQSENAEIKSFIIGEPFLFNATYTTSMLSAGIGLAKCLKVRIY